MSTTDELKTKTANIIKPLLAEVNTDAEGTDISCLVGKKFLVKKQGKRKTRLNFHGMEISIENKYLNF